LTLTRAFGLTAYTAAIPQIMLSFEVPMTKAILGFSIYLFGIFFAPIYTPHLSERHGRSIIYLISIFCCGLFHLGAALSQKFAGLAICRFFAGLAGGPCLVLIEGTFADIWAAETTNTYYAFLACASYFGAASGMYLLPSMQLVTLIHDEQVLWLVPLSSKEGSGNQSNTLP
jgi:DHA1 family multidrug resistance protein-like MFS transporter